MPRLEVFMTYSKVRTRFHPNLLNSPPIWKRLRVQHTLPPGVTLWMLNWRSRLLKSSVTVRHAGRCCFVFLSLFSCWAEFTSFSNIQLHVTVQLCRSMCPAHVVWVWTSVCVSIHSMWGELRNSTLPFRYPLPHIFLLSLILGAMWSSPCSPLPGNCLLAEFPGSG